VAAAVPSTVRRAEPAKAFSPGGHDHHAEQKQTDAAEDRDQCRHFGPFSVVTDDRAIRQRDQDGA